MNKKHILWPLFTIIGFGLFYWILFNNEHNAPYETFKPRIEAKKHEIKDITTDIKEQSKQSVKKGDSLVNLLKHEPWKLSKEDMKDSTIVNYLKNYIDEE